jgi:hypothetical protein
MAVKRIWPLKRMSAVSGRFGAIKADLSPGRQALQLAIAGPSKFICVMLTFAVEALWLAFITWLVIRVFF